MRTLGIAILVLAACGKSADKGNDKGSGTPVVQPPPSTPPPPAVTIDAPPSVVPPAKGDTVVITNDTAEPMVHAMINLPLKIQIPEGGKLTDRPNASGGAVLEVNDWVLRISEGKPLAEAKELYKVSLVAATSNTFGKFSSYHVKEMRGDGTFTVVWFYTDKDGIAMRGYIDHRQVGDTYYLCTFHIPKASHAASMLAGMTCEMLEPAT
jgi:hypothetical protein